ncbi:MAG: hypothetical protein KHZ58_11345 [Hungatella hathewayi]|nr:hypothetical protein [Hungatella hathewayi]
MIKLRRIMSVMLAVVLAAGAIAGCGTKGGSGQTGETPVKESTSGEPPSGETAAMGRYKEETVGLPDEMKDELYYTAFQGKDNKMELYTGKRNENSEIVEICRYVYDNNMWVKDEAWWGPALQQQYDISFKTVIYGMDNRYYLAGMDVDYRYHLYKVSEDGTAVELIEDVFEPQSSRRFGMIPQKVSVTAEGDILLCNASEAYLYGQDGEKKYTMTYDYQGNEDDKNMFVDGNEFVTILEGAVVRYSLLDGQVKETIPYDGLQSGRNGVSAVLFSDGTDGIYIANENGLSHINKGGTVWENIIDGSLNSMGMRSLNMKAYMMGGSDDYYGFYTDQHGLNIMMCHYTYDKNMASVPPVTLNVYALYDNSTVRQAAALLQKDNPDVRVEFRAAIQDDSGAMTEEVIRSLNTELLNGKGADVLILDGLPVDSYIEKGVLMDMRELFARIQFETPLCTNILDGFTGEDGSVYEMPARVAMPAAMGGEKAIAAFSSMEAMASYQGEHPLLSAETYENLLRLVANIQYQELFGNGIEGLSEELLQKYLEAVKAIGESNGSRVEFTEDEMNVAMANNNVVPKGIRGYAMSYDREMSDGGLEYLDSIFSTALLWVVMDKHPEASLEPVNGVYFPSSIVGINQATKVKEAAEEFVRYLFSTPVQKENFYDGFPVQMEALEFLSTDDSNANVYYSIGSSFGDYELTGGWPSKEKCEYVLKMIPQLTVPVDVDENVMGMIVSESKEYFEGKETSAQAASKISQKIRLYLAE